MRSVTSHAGRRGECDAEEIESQERLPDGGSPTGRVGLRGGRADIQYGLHPMDTGRSRGMVPPGANADRMKRSHASRTSSGVR